MFSKSKKLKEGKVWNGKESFSYGLFSSMIVFFLKNIFFGKFWKNLGGYVIIDGSIYIFLVKNG